LKIDEWCQKDEKDIKRAVLVTRAVANPSDNLIRNAGHAKTKSKSFSTLTKPCARELYLKETQNESRLTNNGTIVGQNPYLL